MFAPSSSFTLFAFKYSCTSPWIVSSAAVSISATVSLRAARMVRLPMHSCLKFCTTSATSPWIMLISPLSNWSELGFRSIAILNREWPVLLLPYINAAIPDDATVNGMCSWHRTDLRSKFSWDMFCRFHRGRRWRIPPPFSPQDVMIWR